MTGFKVVTVDQFANTETLLVRGDAVEVAVRGELLVKLNGAVRAAFAPGAWLSVLPEVGAS